MRYLVPALYDLGEMLRGANSLRSSFTKRPASRFISWYEACRLIAVSGLDMAAWDALVS